MFPVFASSASASTMVWPEPEPVLIQVGAWSYAPGLYFVEYYVLFLCIQSKCEFHFPQCILLGSSFWMSAVVVQIMKLLCLPLFYFCVAGARALKPHWVSSAQASHIMLISNKTFCGSFLVHAVHGVLQLETNFGCSSLSTIWVRSQVRIIIWWMAVTDCMHPLIYWVVHLKFLCQCSLTGTFQVMCSWSLPESEIGSFISFKMLYQLINFKCIFCVKQMNLAQQTFIWKIPIQVLIPFPMVALIISSSLNYCSSNTNV